MTFKPGQRVYWVDRQLGHATGVVSFVDEDGNLWLESAKGNRGESPASAGNYPVWREERARIFQECQPVGTFPFCNPGKGRV